MILYGVMFFHKYAASVALFVQTGPHHSISSRFHPIMAGVVYGAERCEEERQRSYHDICREELLVL